MEAKQLKLTFLLAVLMSIVGAKAFAHDIAVKNADGKTIYYTYMNNETELAVSYQGSSYSSYSNEYSGVVNIPESVIYGGKTYPVTSIGKMAFLGCTGLTSVTIGNSVTSIGDQAFYDCSGLTSVTIGNSVTSIGYYAFGGCSGLTSVTIPNSVTSIGDQAFYDCSGLTSVTIPNSVTSIGSSAFSGCTGLTSFTIPNSVTSIGSFAFSGCTGLTSVTIPNSVTSIGTYAFAGCTGLTSVTINSNAIMSKEYTNYSSLKNSLRYIFGEQVKSYTIGDGVTSIGGYAFEGCTGLTSVTISNSVTRIGNGAFEGCTGLTKVIVNDIAAWCNISFGNSSSNPLYYAKHLYRDKKTEIRNLVIPNGVTTIKDYAFSGCTGLTSVTIPNSVTSIGESAFSGCTGLTSVTIPNSVTSIGSLAFYGCSGLKSVTIGNSVTSIGLAVFAYCSGLTSVTIGNSVTSIGPSAFYHCSALTSVTIPNSVTSIGSLAFAGCTGLTSVLIPNSVTSIVSQAFEGCSGLTSVTIGNSVTSIGSSAFRNCFGLTSVIIGNSVTSIGSSAFYGCSGLTSVTIGNSVTSIGKNAFGDCSGLTDIYCHIEEPLTIASNVFNNVPQNTCTLHVPIGSKVKYQAADVWKDFLNIVEDLPGRSTQTITWAQSLSSVVSLGCEIELNAVASTGLPITYTIMSGNDYATLVTSGEKTFLRGVKAGTVVVEAKQVGNNEYLPASVEKEFTISELRTAQTITWSQIQAYVVGLNSDIELTAVASSGLPITYVIKSGSDCATLITSGDKTSLRGIKIGTVVIEAKQDGNSEYQPASVEKEFTINKKTSQRITWSQEIEAVVGDSLILSATSSSGLPVAYRSLDEDYCSKMEIKQNAEGQYVVYFSSGAPFIIEAYQDGNDVYNAAEPVRKYYNSLNPTETDGLMCINGIYYKYTDNTHTALKMVRGFKQYKGDMVFPAVVNGLPVTNMESDATYICPIITSIEFEEGHSRIEGIHYDMALKKLILPSTTTYIDYLVLHCCPKLKDVYLYATTPPEVSSYCDYDQWTEGEGKTLYVPRGTKSAYENADFWKHFTIVEIDVPTGIISIDNSQSAIDNDVWFTLSGVRLNGKPTKAGIYIVNGKKVVVK